MSRFSIFYATRNGQTEQIAFRIRDVLKESAHEVRVESVRGATKESGAEDADAIVLGAPVYGGRHLRPFGAFVKRHLPALNDKPSFFFSVSLSAAGQSEAQQSNARRCLDEFLSATGWRPRHTATFAGSLLYRDYNFLLRWLMKRIARKEGGDTDTTRNYHYTDWEAVENFARTCVAQSVSTDTPE